MKISKKEFTLPFKFSKRRSLVEDAENKHICLTYVDTGQFIADALNEKAESGWRRVTDGLPTEDGEYLVTCELTEFGESFLDSPVTVHTFGHGEWQTIHPKVGKVIAWRFKPAAYEPLD
jgi:hypothetical protein